ncbi:MAG: hypothetical protein KDK41_12300 [Leptospiraceae bacterium]|nr:hypothetical protein [Leptospiraceae bacterium]MCB1201419.1 hypothetical protein [Leptospiraceae bacterium]
MEVFAGLVFLGVCLVLSSVILVSIRTWQVRPELIRKIFRYLVLGGLYMVLSVGAIILGLRVDDRHRGSYEIGRKAVQEIWGGEIVQNSPSFTYNSQIEEEYIEEKTGASKTRIRTIAKDAGIQSQKISIDLKKNVRKKGLLQFAGYELNWKGEFTVTNTATNTRFMRFYIPLPSGAGNLTDLEIKLNGKEFTEDTNAADGLDWAGNLQPGQTLTFEWGYKAQGSGSFRYALAGGDRIEIGKLDISLKTDYNDIVLPDNSMVPTSEAEDSQGTAMSWVSQKLITGQDIALKIRLEGNWGEIVPRLFFFTPLSLFLFFSLLLIGTLSADVRLHPMQWFLIGAGFFVFPLLSSYLFTYTPVLVAMAIGLVVSTGLMIWYGNMLSIRENLVKPLIISSVVFQWFFSVAFMFPEHTGLLLTVAVIASLAWLMQKSAKTNWEDKW